jgi:hypothetical protein
MRRKCRRLESDLFTLSVIPHGYAAENGRRRMERATSEMEVKIR